MDLEKTSGGQINFVFKLSLKNKFQRLDISHFVESATFSYTMDMGHEDSLGKGKYEENKTFLFKGQWKSS